VRLGWAFDRYFIKQPRLRRVATRVIYGKSDQPISLFGAGLTINSEFENGYLRAFRNSKFVSVFRDEAAVLINLANLVSDNCTFLDIGANIGIFSAVMSRFARIKRNVRVIAFEVDPNTFSRLALNARRHGFDAHNIGLADAERSIEFVRGAVSHVTTPLRSRNSYSIPKETFTAKCAPLAAFDIPRHDIVMKIDVEGCEYEVLLGARRYFEEQRVKAVYFDGVSKIDETRRFLSEFDFELLDGHTLEPFEPGGFALLALRREPATDPR
jgi:FkbM family methyltransferase